MWTLCCHSLWMQLVQGAVDPHGDAKMLQVAVEPDLVDHGSHAGSTELGGSAGHHAAHLLHQDAVLTGGAGQAQVLQDGAHLPQGQAVTGGGGMTKEVWGGLMRLLPVHTLEYKDYKACAM